MSRKMLSSAKEYLAEASSLRIAHLVRLETASTPSEYIYLTDYLADIQHNGVPYEAGKVTQVGSIKQGQGLTNYKLSITIAGEFEDELARGLTENLESSYVGRTIEVLRAYIDTDGSIIDFFDENGNDVGTGNKPLPYFIGEVTNIDIEESITSGSSRVTWQCAGKLADFDIVAGRQTSDVTHRGLQYDVDLDVLQPTDGAKLPSHMADRGFQHAAQTISVSSTYTSSYTAYRTKKTRWWKRDKKVAYEVIENHDLELGVDLAATFIPKVYGVRKVAGIPVFLDVLKDDPTKVYIVYAFAEGEVDAFLNFHLEGDSIICANASSADADVCLGNMQNGDTLSKFMNLDALPEVVELEDSIYTENGHIYYEEIEEIEPVAPVEVVPNSRGTIHLKGITGGNNKNDEEISHFSISNSSGTKQIWVHHGKPDQNANQMLVNLAANNKFLGQQDWVDEDPENRVLSQYWDDDCKLLDTAYAVMLLTVSTGEEASLPELEAVIESSKVSTYSLEGVESPNQQSLNPVWHLLDYITSPVYGGGSVDATGTPVGLTIDDIDVESFAYVASKFDTLSTTYDAGFLDDSWRYIGWKTSPVSNDPRKTVMQCNSVIKTETSVTKNVASILSQIDGTLNILGGKYHLSIETNDDTIADIDAAECLGAIKTKDLSSTGKWNSIQASITDPNNDWETTTIDFFSSEFLAKDNGIKKKGNVGFNMITNYYTAREWAERQLNKSRFSRELTVTLPPKYSYLYPNANVTFSYQRFWEESKTFRVTSVTLNSTGTVSATLEDFDASIYEGSPTTQNPGRLDNVHTVLPPSGLEYTTLPDARFDISTLDTSNVTGILTWDSPVGTAVITRYDIRDWQEESTDYSVGISQTITDQDTGKEKHYIFITSLAEESPYTFKVRSIPAVGSGSKYAVLSIFTGSEVEPVTLDNVTDFIATNATNGLFDGGNLSMSWVEVEDSMAQAYEIDIRDEFDIISLRTVTLLVGNTTYTYSIADNILDYTATYGGAGASRSVIVKIRSTNGQSSANADFRSSTWKSLL